MNNAQLTGTLLTIFENLNYDAYEANSWSWKVIGSGGYAIVKD